MFSQQQSFAVAATSFVDDISGIAFKLDSDPADSGLVRLHLTYPNGGGTVIRTFNRNGDLKGVERFDASEEAKSLITSHKDNPHPPTDEEMKRIQSDAEDVDKKGGSTRGGANRQASGSEDATDLQRESVGHGKVNTTKSMKDADVDVDKDAKKK